MKTKTKAGVRASHLRSDQKLSRFGAVSPITAAARRSLSVNLTSKASSTPGAATIRKAVRQPQASAAKPPITGANMVASDGAALTKDITVPRWRAVK